ncbi:alpha/beta fold hydrolase [Paenibacillus chibensis]|uniref:alpha/beta fold hydrolase n=1 Tax=Paenibacillus chibensis TaxID=59846 RepID=UPI000FD8EF41|nr:alpha/beta hydrolase [Paenibacillus chibensis]MEC0369350.1 alpha/beta hydrolase [Paenibacillus chibensis]
MKTSQAQEQTGFVFIHGAGLDSTIWKRVAIQLEAPCLLIDFPHRQEKSASRKQLSLEDYTEHLSAQINGWEVKRFFLVAHSIGGVPALRIASKHKAQLAGFVAVGAVIPAEGESFMSVFPPARRILMGMMMRVFGTRPPEAVIRQGLCSDLPPEQCDDIVRRFTPESLRLYSEPVAARIPSELPSMYVKLQQDKEVSPTLQDRMIRNLRADHTALLDSGHLPMLSRPDELRTVLHEFMNSNLGGNNRPAPKP